MRALVSLLLIVPACWTGSEPVPATPPPVIATPGPSHPRNPPRHRNPMDVAFEKFTEFTDEMCACRDQACAMAVSDKLQKWAETEAKEGARDQKATDEQMRDMQALGMRLGECMSKAMSPPATP